MSGRSAAAGHRALVVEDQPSELRKLEALVRSRGDRPRAVATVDEALAALAEETFCYVILDQQLPTSVGEEPMLGGGERVLIAARKIDHRRNADGFHLLPVLVVTGYSKEPDFVAKMFDLGCDGFLAKPLDQNVEKLLDRIRVCLGRAGRLEHEGCGGKEERARPAVPSARVRLAMDGTTSGGRTAVRVCGERRDVQDATFSVLLRFIVAHERGRGVYSSREALGFGKSRNATSRVRETFEGLVPEGFEVIEGDRRGGFRLNPEIEVEAVDWGGLEGHPDPGVRRIAGERRKRG